MHGKNNGGLSARKSPSSKFDATGVIGSFLRMLAEGRWVNIREKY